MFDLPRARKLQALSTTFLIAVALLTGCSDMGVERPRKPDLIIESISYSRLPQCHTSELGGVFCTGPLFGFAMTVRNTGNATYSEHIFEINTRTKWEFENLDFPHGHLLNYGKLPITPGDTMVFTFTDILHDSVAQLIFAINTHAYSAGGNMFRIYDEADYTNNSYLLDIAWSSERF